MSMTFVTRGRTAVGVLILGAVLHALSAPALEGQASDDGLEAIASWVAVDAATGYERRVAATLASALGSGWTADAYGNVVATVGSGSPHRVIACALDRPGYAVSQIRDDGYLRVHRIGAGSRHPLWDQQFEAQQVRVSTAAGPVAGVVAVPNAHFAAQHAGETAIVTADDLWIDVGAGSRAEVEALGIALLDPVGRHLPPWVIAGAVAGPDAGRRTGCAAVVAVAAAARDGAIAPGRSTFVLSAQQVIGWVGLSSLLARGERIDQLTLLAPGEEARGDSAQPVTEFGRFASVLDAIGLKTVRMLAPSVEQAGSHMEIVRATEAEWLRGVTAAAAGRAGASGIRWVAAPPVTAWRTDRADGAFRELSSVLSDLVERHAVSGHEWSVRRAVLQSLPAWARERAAVDDIGNITVEAGPPGPATVFMAHMDEVGYLIGSIAPDGTATLRPQGGPVASAWEGQTALVHFDPPGAPSTVSGLGSDLDPRWKAQSLEATAPPPLRGVFRIRAAAKEKNPGVMQAWFGLDAKSLAARGVVPGMQVTSHKEGVRLGRARYTARSLDDRAGTAALLRAIGRIDPERLPGRVVFAWSVNEEGGLRGAAAMASRFGRTSSRIYSVDTFVTSDTPLESPHFAYAPLGKGAVLRAIENASVSPEHERQRVRRAADSAGVPLQIGLTQGGTDGTTFTFWGAPNQGLSWPGRYSHSPGEVLDLRDLDALTRLIVALATVREQ
jgi:putative aminopeptidase FrvX